MLDVGFGVGGRDELRPDAQTGHVGLAAAGRGELEIEIAVGFGEMVDEFARALIADGVRGGAGRSAELEDGARPGHVLLVFETHVEYVFATFGWGGGVVPGVGPHVSAVVGPAVTDPENVPGVTIGVDLRVNGVMLNGKGPVD